MKIFLIAVLCVSQGLAVKPFFGKGGEPCKYPLPESAEAIPHDFEEAIYEMDDIRDTVTAAAMESYFKGTDPKVIIACFNQQRENFDRLGREIYNKIRKGAEEIGEELGDKYEEFAKRAAEPFSKIADTLRTLPEKILDNIKNQEFIKALQVFRESRRIVEENSRIIADIVGEFTDELPEVAEKAQKLAQEVREDARKGCETIERAFRKCVQEGGPKVQFEESEVQLAAEAQ